MWVRALAEETYMPSGKLERTLLVLAACAVLAGCGGNGRREAELAATPVRQVIASLSVHPHWQAGRCLCVGHFHGKTVEDFPDGVLDDVYAKRPWIRRWTECAPLYGQKKGLPQCRVSMTDYICGVAAKQPDLPKGTTRVRCFVNGANELLIDEYNVTEEGGRFAAKRIVSKAFDKLHE